MIRASIRQAHSFVRGAFRELPVETVAVLAEAASLILLVQRHVVDELVLARVACAAPIVAALGFALTLVARAGHLRRPVQLGLGAAMGAGVLAAVWLGLQSSGDEEAFAWRYGASLIAALLIPFAAVALAAPRAARFDAFASFVRRFLEQTSAWGTLGAAALIALGIVFGSLAALFDLEVQRLGAQTGLVVIAGVALAWLYRLLPDDDGIAQVPELWRRLITTIGAPFVAVMLIILSAYEIWALACDELPRNMLSPLVVISAAVGFVCTLVMVAVLREPSPGALAPADPHPWTRNRSVQVVRAFPLAVLALLPMAAWALAIRIDEYGFTPVRVGRIYALVAVGAVALFGAVRYLRRQAPLAWEVPLIVAALALVAGFGPLSVVSISVRSQSARLEAELAAAGLPHRGDPIVLEYDAYTSLSSRITLVHDLGGDDAVRAIRGGALAPCTAEIWTCIETLGAKRRGWEPQRWIRASVSGPFQVDGRAVEVVHLRRGESIARGALTLTLAAASVEARIDGRVVAVAPLAALLTQADKEDALSSTPLAFDGGAAAGTLLVTELTGAREATEVAVESIDAIWIH